MPGAAKGPNSSKLRKTETGAHVSSKNKSGDAQCSAAASAWVLGRKAGSVAAGVYKILAACRAKVRQNKGAVLKQASGKLAAGRGTWQRGEKAHALLMARAAKRQPAQGHMAADAHATKATAAKPASKPWDHVAPKRAPKTARPAAPSAPAPAKPQPIEHRPAARFGRIMGKMKTARAKVHEATRPAFEHMQEAGRKLAAARGSKQRAAATAEHDAATAAYLNHPARLQSIRLQDREHRAAMALGTPNLRGRPATPTTPTTPKRTPTAADRLAARAEAHGDTPGNRRRRLEELLAARKARTTTTTAPKPRPAPAPATRTDRAEHSTRAVKDGIRAGTHGHPEIEAHVSALAATHTAAELKDLHQRITGVKAASGKAAVQGIAKDLHRAHQAHEQVKEINAIGVPKTAHAPVASSAAAAEAHGKASERVARVVAAARPAPAPEHVRDAILGHANHLLREEHGHTGLVPIHQIRDRVEAHLGPVPHGDFDRHLNDLRREGKLRMLPGTARDLADPEHARKSFAGPDETWFHVEKPAAPSAAFKGPERQSHAPGVVRDAIAGHAARLRGEKYAATGLVPIHEVRAAVHADLGPAAASHEVFDRHVLDLHREGKAKLLPINDATHVSAAQMNAAIPGNHETWFYLEHRGAADATHAPLMSEAAAHRRAQAAIGAARR